MGSVLKTAGLGVCIALGRWMRIPGISVLVYHSIDDSGSYMSTPPSMFRVQMEWLRENGLRTISVRQFFDRPSLDDLPERTLVLTFDDGLANFADTAWPILKGLGFSATVYVPTDFIGGDAAWYADYNLPRLQCMGWDTLRALARDGADVESHGCAHIDLTTLLPERLDTELRRSRACLEDGLSAPVEHLAYPFGADSDPVREAVRRAGYRSAVSLASGRYRPGIDLHSIPRDGLDRIAIRTERTARLSMEACVQGTYAWYVGVKARIGGLCSLPPHLRRR